LTTVRLDGANAFAKAGLVAAALWIVGIGARMGFALWADVYDDDHEELQACEANPASGSALGRMPCTTGWPSNPSIFRIRPINRTFPRPS